MAEYTYVYIYVRCRNVSETNNFFWGGSPSVELQILGQANDTSAVVGVSKDISSSSVLQASGFVNTIISSKHYLKSFVVVVGG